MLVWLVIVRLLWACSWSGANSRPLTRAYRQLRGTQGAARGYFAPHPPHYAFLGLPYATTTERFKGPGLSPSWDGIFEASHRVKCPQKSGGDENCLVLNLFVPENATSMPVVVFVHDGDFQSGQGTYKPPGRLLSQGIVVVTFNYRLGMLGFLCMGTAEAPGNAGLKDQVAALYWIQKNIASFGGDPSDVTLYGIGSGAVAVNLLLLSGLTDGLFHKAVIESGSALSPQSISYDPILTAVNAAVELGYQGGEDKNELLDFFKTQPVHKITNTSVIFLPCLESPYSDQSLIILDPIEVLRKGTYQQVPLFVSYSSEDGISVIRENFPKFYNMPENFESSLPTNLKFNDHKTKQRIATYVKELYFDDRSKPMDENFAEYLHDVLYEYPILKSSILYAEQSSMPVYVMKFIKEVGEHKMSFNRMIDYISANENLEEHEIIAEKFVTLLTNFIQLGDPTPIKTSLIPVIWEPVTDNSIGLLNVQCASVFLFGKTLTMGPGFNQKLIFWDHIYESFFRTQISMYDEFISGLQST